MRKQAENLMQQVGKFDAFTGANYGPAVGLLGKALMVGLPTYAATRLLTPKVSKDYDPHRTAIAAALAATGLTALPQLSQMGWNIGHSTGLGKLTNINKPIGALPPTDDELDTIPKEGSYGSSASSHGSMRGTSTQNVSDTRGRTTLGMPRVKLASNQGTAATGGNFETKPTHEESVSINDIMELHRKIQKHKAKGKVPTGVNVAYSSSDVQPKIKPSTDDVMGKIVKDGSLNKWVEQAASLVKLGGAASLWGDAVKGVQWLGDSLGSTVGSVSAGRSPSDAFDSTPRPATHVGPDNHPVLSKVFGIKNNIEIPAYTPPAVTRDPKGQEARSIRKGYESDIAKAKQAPAAQTATIAPTAPQPIKPELPGTAKTGSALDTVGKMLTPLDANNLTAAPEGAADAVGKAWSGTSLVDTGVNMASKAAPAAESVGKKLLSKANVGLGLTTNAMQAADQLSDPRAKAEETLAGTGSYGGGALNTAKTMVSEGIRGWSNPSAAVNAAVTGVSDTMRLNAENKAIQQNMQNTQAQTAANKYVQPATSYMANNNQTKPMDRLATTSMGGSPTPSTSMASTGSTPMSGSGSTPMATSPKGRASTTAPVSGRTSSAMARYLVSDIIDRLTDNVKCAEYMGTTGLMGSYDTYLPPGAVTMSIPTHYTAQQIDNDLYMSPQEKSKAMMILGEASNGQPGLISMGDVGRAALGAGIGYASAALFGKVLGGIFGGLAPQTQRRLQQTGMVAGMLVNTGALR